MAVDREGAAAVLKFDDAVAVIGRIDRRGPLFEGGGGGDDLKDRTGLVGIGDRLVLPLGLAGLGPGGGFLLLSLQEVDLLEGIAVEDGIGVV